MLRIGVLRTIITHSSPFSIMILYKAWRSYSSKSPALLSKLLSAIAATRDARLH